MFGRLGATEIWILVGLVLLFLLGMWIGNFRRPRGKSPFELSSPPDLVPAPAKAALPESPAVPEVDGEPAPPPRSVRTETPEP